MSEIDHIFASIPISTSPTLPQSSHPPKKIRKNQKSTKKLVYDNVDPAPISNKRSVPETIIDPSTQPANPKRHKPAIDPITPRNRRPRPKQDKKEEEQFKDSRGTSQRRKTDEGWAIYKEDELGLNDEGGDTPLCPFDCQCCV